MRANQSIEIENLCHYYRAHKTEANVLIEIDPLSKLSPVSDLSTQRGSRPKREAKLADNRKPLHFFKWLFRLKSVTAHKAPEVTEVLTKQSVRALLTKIHPSLDAASLEVLNLSASEILGFINNTTSDQKKIPNKALMLLAGALISTINSHENKKECLIILSSMLTSPYFIDSLTLNQHQEIAKLIKPSLFSSSAYAGLNYKKFLEPLLAMDTPKAQPYIQLSMNGFIRILEKSMHSSDQAMAIRNNLIINKLINTPSFLTSLTSKQHKKFADFFQAKIAQPTNEEKYLYDLPANTQIANALMKQRDTYIIFSGILLINGFFSNAPKKDRFIWLDSMSKAISTLNDYSLNETELDLIKDSMQDLQHLNADQKTFLKLESGLCDQLAFFEKGLIAYQATLSKKSSVLTEKNEKIALKNMTHDLQRCIFEQLSQMKSIYA